MGRLIVFSGAGLSAESGVETFRASDGLWTKHDVAVVCDYRTWKKPDNNPVMRRFYDTRRTELATVAPNAAHQMIADWQRRYETVLLTQNVDDLLERAGCTDVVHLHGRIREMHCTACGHVWDIGYTAFGVDGRCPVARCRSHIGVKPNVVFFHQEAPLYAVLNKVMRSLSPADVVLVSGTSGQVIDITGYLFDKPSYHLFNGLEKPSSVAYHELYIKPATQAFPEIDRILRRRLG